jgi:hypothetical protein
MEFDFRFFSVRVVANDRCFDFVLRGGGERRMGVDELAETFRRERKDVDGLFGTWKRLEARSEMLGRFDANRRCAEELFGARRHIGGRGGDARGSDAGEGRWLILSKRTRGQERMQPR